VTQRRKRPAARRARGTGYRRRIKLNARAVPVLEGWEAADERICLEAPILQPVRHTDARRFAQSGAAENDRHPARKLSEALGDHVGGDSQRAARRCKDVVAAAYINQERSVGDQLLSDGWLDPQR
jgi:hypothetical protein